MEAKYVKGDRVRVKTIDHFDEWDQPYILGRTGTVEGLFPGEWVSGNFYEVILDYDTRKYILSEKQLEFVEPVQLELFPEEAKAEVENKEVEVFVKITSVEEYDTDCGVVVGDVFPVKEFDDEGAVIYTPEGTHYVWLYQYVIVDPLEDDKFISDDEISRPAHYNAGEVEVIDYIHQVCRDYPGDEAANVANIIKYVSRAPHKGTKLKDLKKTLWYLQDLIALIEEKEDVVA